MKQNNAFAAQFRQLHDRPAPLVLPNVWDVATACLFQRCGASALATTSAGVAWAHGYPDGNALPVEILVSVVREITRCVSVPLTVDVEGGYSDDVHSVRETVAAVIDAGAIGINLEDGNKASGLLCAKIEAAREAARDSGVDLFINARTDLYLHPCLPPEKILDSAIARLREYESAGCDGIFVPGLVRSDEIKVFVQATNAPLNVMVMTGLPSVKELGELGVRRVSAGTGIARAALGAAERAARALTQDGSYAAIFDFPVSYDEMNNLFQN